MATRSDAVREGLRLVHKTARYAALAQEYDDFYGAGAQAPTGVWDVQFPGCIGTRPCVVLTSNPLIGRLGTATVVEVTRP